MPEINKPTVSPCQSPILTQRYAQMQDWLQEINQSPAHSLNRLAGDASFRCYYRLVNDKGSFVIMDAPPDKESCVSFVAVAKILGVAGVHVPVIYHQDLSRGFLLLSDLGDDLFLSQLTSGNADGLYQKAFETLLAVQQVPLTPEISLPSYSKSVLLREMQLFIDWYLVKYKKIAMSRAAQQELEKIFMLLIDNAKAQPQVCVHRDFHSRNLLLCKNDRVGVLDFQDAVCGPITYDLVSLLRDCYVAWPQAKIDAWVLQYYLQSKEHNRLAGVQVEQFIRWFDLMGLQRHLKCLGIFVRLYVRDQKPNYLNDIPRVLTYARMVCNKYSELTPLLNFLVN